MPQKFDIIIIGSGIAGLAAAIEAGKSKEYSVALLERGSEKSSNSYYAQGGIACASGKGDSWKSHAQDTLAAGAGLCDENIVNLITKKGPECISELMGIGFEFDGGNKKPELGLEGGHSQKRVLHKNGDQTGKEMTKFMRKVAEEQGNLQIFDNCLLSEIQISKNEYAGMGAFGKETEFVSKALILATGGYAAVYEKTTNPETTVGIGIGTAYSAGCEISGMEFVQFHPTTLRSALGSNFLVTEAVRGEGGKIVNGKGKQIVNPLLTRDKVSVAIYKEMAKGEKVYLDARGIRADFAERFPTVHNELVKSRIDPARDLIPIETAAHYTIGGIKTNENAMASVKGIYAAGECSCSGLHGANRLASNSLLEGLVMGKIAAQNALKQKSRAEMPNAKKTIEAKEGIGQKIALPAMRKTMWNCCGVVRTEQGLKDGLAGIIALEGRIEKSETPESVALENALKACRLTFEACLKRKESVGTHYIDE